MKSFFRRLELQYRGKLPFIIAGARPADTILFADKKGNKKQKLSALIDLYMKNNCI